MPEETTEGDDSGRRQFFQSGAREFLRFLGELVEPSPKQARTPRPIAPPGPKLLRPPGALPDDLFLETCDRSGECVRACPAEAILPYYGPEGALQGTPYIVARESPCVVCDDLSCMKACPSGALELVPVEQIRMGIAQVDYRQCRRSDPDDECEVCVQSCPLGASAIRLDEDGFVQVREGCIGCGVCEFQCPTEPTSICVQV